MESRRSTLTGILSDAAVEGLMSCSGEGLKFMDAVWMVSAISSGSEDIMTAR